MKAIRVALASLRKADNLYNLINDGDKILIGLSGGKDSVCLTYCLNLYKKFSHIDFTIQPVILDLGFPNFNPQILKDFCASIGLDLIVYDAKEVYPILKKQQGNLAHLPCSICSRMKKASINKLANELHFNKVAFAHHVDDAIETLFMNEIYGGRIATFSPKMHLEKANITFIRPFTLLKEEDIIRTVKEEKLPILASSCPADKHTKREDIKLMLSKLYKEFPSSKENFITMLANFSHYDLWGENLSYKVDDEGLTLKHVLNKSDAFNFFNIRHEVFVKEQQIPYNDEFNYVDTDNTNSYLICLNNEPVGTIIAETDKENKLVTFKRLAIIKQFRNKKIATKVLNFLIKENSERIKPCTFTLNAQENAISFYEKLGFKKDSDPFIEGNIKHIKMKKVSSI